MISTKITSAITHVVWDWNGTLLDDVACCTGVINQVLDEYRLPRLADVDAYRTVFRFPIIDYYADLGFDVSLDGNFEAAAHRYIELYHAAADGWGLHDGVRDTLASLHAAKIRQVIISASQQANLVQQLAPFELDRWIEAAHGLDDIYAASEEGIARHWLAAEGVDPAHVLFVGDSEHDFEIAQAVGARSALVANGHHGRDHLIGLGAVVLDDVRDVAALVLSRA